MPIDWFIEKYIFIAETKSQYARDDPAFLVLLIVSLCGKTSNLVFL